MRIECPECERPLDLEDLERVICVCGFAFVVGGRAEGGAFRGGLELRGARTEVPARVVERKEDDRRVFLLSDRVPFRTSRAVGTVAAFAAIVAGLTVWFGAIPGVVGGLVAAGVVFPRRTRRERVVIGEGGVTLIGEDLRLVGRLGIDEIHSIQAVQTDSTHWCVLLRSKREGGEGLLIGHPLGLDEGTARWLAQRLRGLLGG